MKKRTLVTAGALVFFMLCIFSFGFINTAPAQYGEDIIVSFESNGAWVLSKVTRKLMFFNYHKKDLVWSTNPIILPSSIDLNNCTLQAVGSRGTSAFLYDGTNHIVWFFQAIKDGSIKQYVNFNVGVKLK
jgi:hypothetical protein